MWQRISAAFVRAAALEPAEREAFLGELRREDSLLSSEVESLLRQEDVDTPVGSVPRALPSALTEQTSGEAKVGEGIPDKVGPYQVEEKIGRGGMGVVVRAVDAVFHRRLAVKILIADLADNADLKARFLEEAQIMGQLQHPGIPPVHELGKLADGRPFYSMKLIQGQTLAALLQGRASQVFGTHRDAGLREAPGATQRRPDPAERACLIDIFEDLCQTIAFAHSRGIIHRDLKPSNVMVGAFGEVQVMDWGLAKVLSPPAAAGADGDRVEQAGAVFSARASGSDFHTLPGLALGTPGYMAPEQARGEIDQLDERCDVFSLGAILCAILTGQPPFAGHNAAEILAAAQESRLEQALQRLDSCGADAELVALCKRCLSPSREARPPHAGEVAATITAYQQQVQERLRHAEIERAQAQIKAEEERKRREVEQAKTREERRRRRLTVTLAAVLLLFLASGAVALFSWQRAEFHRQRRLVQARQSVEALVQTARDQGQQADFQDRGAFRRICRPLAEAFRGLPEDPDLAAARTELAAARDRFADLAACQDGFLSWSDEAWFMSGEERGAETRLACERALTLFGVLEHADWWKRAPAGKLTEAQRHDLQREAYRLLLLLAALRIQRGLEAYQKHTTVKEDLAQSSRAAGEALRRAQDMERARLVPPSVSAPKLDRGVRGLAALPPTRDGLLVLLGWAQVQKLQAQAARGLGRTGPPPLPERFDNDVDYFYLGVTHLFLGKHQADPAALVVFHWGPDEFDFFDAQATAERLLRRSVQTDPRQYWSWFMLGRALAANTDFAGAELAFSSCVSLRPDYSRGYEQRALSLVQRQKHERDARLRAELRGRADQDLRRAAELAPYDPSTYWVRGEALRVLGQRAAALDAYAHAIVLDERLQERVSRRNLLKNVDALVQEVRQGDPGNNDAQALRPLIRLARGELSEARTECEELVRNQPGNQLARLCLGRSLEIQAQSAGGHGATALRQRALLEYQAVSLPEKKDAQDLWRRIEAGKGRHRVLLRLGRPSEAAQVWAQLIHVDPGLAEPGKTSE
jgi:serine/threonine protein kinase